MNTNLFVCLLFVSACWKGTENGTLPEDELEAGVADEMEVLDTEDDESTDDDTSARETSVSSDEQEATVQSDSDTGGDSDSDSDTDVDSDSAEEDTRESSSDSESSDSAESDSDVDDESEETSGSDSEEEETTSDETLSDTDAKTESSDEGTGTDSEQVEAPSDTGSEEQSATEGSSETETLPVAGVTKVSDGLMTYSGLTVVSYGGYLNGESFQQEGVLSFNRYQYTAFWNSNRNVVMARRQLPDGEWAKFDFTDYANSADDAHNTISLGICPKDGTLHLAFDHHGDTLNYRRSNADLITKPTEVPWEASSFSAVLSSLVGGASVEQVTYPRFITAPDGETMLLAARIGSSGSGDELLWEYDGASHEWSNIGKFIDGVSNSVNAYLHGVSYTQGGTRLHVAWCWRGTPDATTNHDLFYMYSDDRGRTWNDNNGDTIAVSGQSQVTINTASARVWTIGQNRGLINQEHMAVDAEGRVHVLLSHMPDNQGDDSDFTRARTKSQFFHYWRDTQDTWHRESIGVPVIKNFRGSLAIASSGNVYAVLPALTIAGASIAENFSDWTALETDASNPYFSDPLIDTIRLTTEDRLTIIYPQESSPNIWGLEYTLR